MTVGSWNRLVMTTRLHRAPLRVLIVGGGVAGLEALLALRALAGGRVATTLISPSDHFSYRALGIGAAFGRGVEHAYPLATVTRRAGAGFLNDTVEHVDVDDRRIALTSGASLDYGAALIAVGARPVPAFDHGITFDRAADGTVMDEVLSDIAAGFVRSLAIVVPPGTGWTLPAYELALLARNATESTDLDVTVRIVTPEHMPLGIFGAHASRTVRHVLSDAEIDVVTARRPDVIGDTVIRAGSHWLTADRIVTLPTLVGPHLAGVPGDSHGFITTDDCCRVPGAPNLFAAGDGSSYPIKQGGLASQQADVAAAHIAARAGAPVEPLGFTPVLRGVLPTTDGPLYLQRRFDDSGSSAATRQPLWSPPTRVASRRLSAFLMDLDLGTSPPPGRFANTTPGLVTRT
jgi:sulfide:quinone oxidoreductase